MSNDVRWSLDLRWQRTDQPVGFHGLKDGVPMRSAANPNMEINWRKFDGNPSLDKVIKDYTKVSSCICTVNTGKKITIHLYLLNLHLA